MKRTGLFLMIVVCCSVSFLLAGCGARNIMKQDPKTLEALCEEEKNKDAEICKYLSKRDNHDKKLVGEMYRIRDIGLAIQKYGKSMFDAAQAYSAKWTNCELGRADSDEKHEDELMQLGALKR